MLYRPITPPLVVGIGGGEEDRRRKEKPIVTALRVLWILLPVIELHHENLMNIMQLFV